MSVSLLLVTLLFVPTNVFPVAFSTSISKITIPNQVLKAAEQWACDDGIFPQTSPGHRVSATYAQVTKNSWEVHWYWTIGGVSAVPGYLFKTRAQPNRILESLLIDFFCSWNCSGFFVRSGILLHKQVDVLHGFFRLLHCPNEQDCTNICSWKKNC